MTIIEALEEFMEARRAHDAARDAYGGYSWGYVGQPLIMRLHDAEKAVDQAIEALIDKKLAERGA